MLLEGKPLLYEGLGYYEGISLILWIASTVLLYITFIINYKKSRKMEIVFQKKIFLAIGIFGLCLGTVRIFFIIGFYNYQYYDVFILLGYVVEIIGALFLMYVLEDYLLIKTKKIFTLIPVIMLGIALTALIGVVTRYIALIIIYILVAFCTIFVIVLQLYLFVKTTGLFIRKWFIVGFTFMFIGHSMDSDLFVSNFPWFPLEIPPIILIVGTILYFWFLEYVNMVEGMASYYNQAHICMVHRGTIKEKVFYCPSCNIPFCRKCFDHVIKQDGCWNCGEGKDDDTTKQWDMREGRDDESNIDTELFK